MKTKKTQCVITLMGPLKGFRDRQFWWSHTRPVVMNVLCWMDWWEDLKLTIALLPTNPELLSTVSNMCLKNSGRKRDPIRSRTMIIWSIWIGSIRRPWRGRANSTLKESLLCWLWVLPKMSSLLLPAPMPSLQLPHAMKLSKSWRAAIHTYPIICCTREGPLLVVKLRYWRRNLHVRHAKRDKIGWRSWSSSCQRRRQWKECLKK